MELLDRFSIELIYILVSGYVGYKVYRIGEHRGDKSEDVIIQSLLFGILAKFLSESIAPILEKNVSIYGEFIKLDGLKYITLTMLVAVSVAALWRVIGSPLFSGLMRLLNVYRDDHASSAIRSITNTKATWAFIQIHKIDGTILESNFSKVPGYSPLRGVTINEDGVAMYVTKIYQENGTVEEYNVLMDDMFSTITYIFTRDIKQIDVSWK